MLTLYVEGDELFDELTSEFFDVKPCKLELEHSLISISKWEAKWEKPFFSDKEFTNEEFLDYIRCMTINAAQVDRLAYKCLSPEQKNKIKKYINAPMTATTFTNHGPDGSQSKRKEMITSELIYYWMTAYNIPFECEKWHINRLLTLVRICGIKNSPPKKMSKRDTMNYYKTLNESRKSSLNTRG